MTDRTKKELKVSPDANMENIGILLMKNGLFPKSYYKKIYIDLVVEVKAGKLYFDITDDAVKDMPFPTEIPHGYLPIGTTSFFPNGLLVPEFDGLYLMTDLLVTFYHSNYTAVDFLINKGRNLSGFELVEKYHTLGENETLWPVPSIKEQEDNEQD